MNACVCEKLQHPGVSCGAPGCECHPRETVTINTPLNYVVPPRYSMLNGRLTMADITIDKDRVTIEFRDADLAAEIKNVMEHNLASGVNFGPTIKPAVESTIKENKHGHLPQHPQDSPRRPRDR